MVWGRGTKRMFVRRTRLLFPKKIQRTNKPTPPVTNKAVTTAPATVPPTEEFEEAVIIR